MELSDPNFMVLLPMLCTSCARPLSNKQDAYEKLIKETTHEDTLDRLGIKNYCCRMHFLSPLTVPFGYSERPIGSIARYEVHEDITQIWEGSNIMARQPETKNSLSVLDQDIINDDDTKLLEAETDMDIVFIPPSEFEAETILEPIQSTTIEPLSSFSFTQPEISSASFINIPTIPFTSPYDQPQIQPQQQIQPQISSLSPMSQISSLPPHVTSMQPSLSTMELPTQPQISSIPPSIPQYSPIQPQISSIPSTSSQYKQIPFSSFFS